MKGAGQGQKLKFRWLKIHASKLLGFHPSARPIYEGSLYYIVLQVCEDDGEWLDIPIVEETTHESK